MPTITDQRVFLPTKDLHKSVDFYRRMGWGLRFQDETLALMVLGASGLLLQNYYQQQWAENTMVHLIVDDAVGWHETAHRVRQEGGFDDVRVQAPRREGYGALVTHVIDPAGVLLHFAEMDASQ